MAFSISVLQDIIFIFLLNDYKGFNPALCFIAMLPDMHPGVYAGSPLLSKRFYD